MKFTLVVALFFSVFATAQKIELGNLIPKQQKLSEQEKKDWHFKDIIDDTIPGISLNKAYKELLKDKKGDTVIVAVLDSGFDINHEDLGDNIWKNSKEVSGNGLDDDNNGYIDDIHGWNFLGNATQTIVYENYEFIRVLKKLKPRFEHINANTIDPKDQMLYSLYLKAQKELDKNIALLKEDYQFLKDVVDARKAIDQYLSRTDYTIEELSQIDPKGDTLLQKHIKERKSSLRYNMDKDWEEYFKKVTEIKEKYSLNIHYDGREIIGDNPEILGNELYGNNDTEGDLELESHGTNVVGIIAANRKNDIGINGVTNLVKIMVIRTTPRGDEYDKDVANGIIYAVDNGAKVINMSFGKEFSLNHKLVHEAIKYAEKNDVLLISSAGNESKNIDEIDYYPNDYDLRTKNEIANNFISVGASTFSPKHLVAYFSNYGKMNVDIFAPGYNIYTTAPKDTYETNGGTSFSAPIVSGIAALIKSYYANLSMLEIKNIILNSGVDYNNILELKQDDGTKKSIPFSELSKSGKVVNAYNALLMAEQMSKRK
ncbi:S8 family serine peptidase [Aquimarina sp. D1M17]|uniref:S8 family serine peptidase n=1 Tax=Aquimarina acroporae TaxID=2937283 RepID=UPI0020C03120|nr:S8 family serine peptidase [Aquimarina acroporae]MCK8521485.1 S8 family serine peptidase [Aquimarina acroporae]